MTNRRGFLGLLAGLWQQCYNDTHGAPCQLQPYPSGSATANCPHDWSVGPFYVAVADGPEEPDYYPPSLLLRTEHCKRCGIIRLPKGYWDATGKTLNGRQEVIPAK